MNKHKILVIGLDGAPPEFIFGWAKKGYLPYLNGLINNGAWGELETTFPPITSSAWSSFLTGKNPGKHGIYDFLFREKGKYSTAPHNRLTRKAKDFWEILNRNGFTTGLINIPMTYPPAKVDGYMITGITTPRKKHLEDVDYTYPKSLKYEIKRNIGEYIIHPKVLYKKDKAKDVYDDLVNELEIKIKTIDYLMERYPTDVTMFVLGGIDRILHELYHLIDPQHYFHNPEESKQNSHLILDYFKKVDEKLGIIINKFCHKDTLIIVMSDHGMGPLFKWVHLNNWLLKEGYLKLKRDLICLIKRCIFKVGLTPLNIYSFLLNFFGFSKANFSFEERDRLITKFFLSWHDIDWTKTRAYSQGNFGQIFINKKNREPKGIVSNKEYYCLKKEIEEKLMKLTDGNMPVVEKMLDREMLYHGKYKDYSADILFMPYKLKYMALGTSAFVSNKIFTPSFLSSGNHRMEGILILNGSGIKKGYRVNKAKIIDIVPNILFYNDLPLDKSMDGKVLEDIYESKFFKKKIIRYEEEIKDVFKKTEDREVYSSEDKAIIKKLLKDLGYFG
jgi:predicted AlkP superfamily phosphohydrolase/phosphomutase